VTPDDFRVALRHFPTGVTIVTTMLDGKPKGFTANAFASVSLEPPMVLICVNRQARSHPIIAAAGLFCVNVLALEQADLARRFALKGAHDPFAEIAYHLDRTGSPVLDGSLAYLDCTLAEEHSVGTHTIFIGEVVATGARDGAPLGYFNMDYRDFGCRIP
jgi:flavin reductase (DIM6/NTAB) family NADH-FMN oxidoreductase RutF